MERYGVMLDTKTVGIVEATNKVYFVAEKKTIKTKVGRYVELTDGETIKLLVKSERTSKKKGE